MSEDLQKLKQTREKYRHKAFKMIIEIGLIIAIPAVVAYFVGGHFDNNLDGGNQTFTLLSLAVAFIFSWTLIIYKYIRFDKKVKEIDKKIKELKQNSDVNDPNSN